MKKFILFLLLPFFVAEINTVKAEPFFAEIIPLNENVTPGENLILAVVINLESGWHSYWRNPGEAGEAINIIWTLPQGFSASEIKWPVPKRFVTAGFHELGYSQKAYLFTEIKIPENYDKKLIPIKANISFLLCGTECIPKNIDLSLDIKIGKKEKLNQEIAKVYETLPEMFPNEVFFLDKGNYLELYFPYNLDDKADFFSYQNEIVAKNKPTINKNTLILEKYKTSFNPLYVSGVLVEKEKNYEVFAKPLTNQKINLLFIVCLAFLGGLILNFMPCVLPLLSLKILGILNAEKEKIRKNSIAYACGILVSFLIIACLIVILKNAGMAIGWGFQMQNPVFVFFLVGLMMLLGLMFSGLFELGTSLVKFGSGKNGAFMSGVLAVLVSSPCVAPFMGTAMAYTLTASALVTLLIFATMAIGLASPFILLSLNTKWIKYIPKTGKWTKRLKEILAIPLYATSCWLVWILEKQTGYNGLCLAIALQLTIVIAVLGKRKSLFLIVAMLFLLGSFFLAENKNVKNIQKGLYITWQPYEQQKFQTLLEQGKPVFLKFSAAWCLTCLINEKIALDTPQTKKIFEQKNIVPISLDWTNKDNNITLLINKYGYNGVPLYIYYPKGKNSQFHVLPQLLTQSMLEKSLNEE